MQTQHKKRAVHRLKILRGQIDGILKAVESDEYCVDILNQSLAVQESLKSLDALLLENHLQTCVTKSIGSKAQGKKIIDELMKVYKFKRKNI